MRTFLSIVTTVGLLLIGFFPNQAAAASCTQTVVVVQNCGSDIDDIDYGGGGVQVTVHLRTACFPEDLSRDIVLDDGSFGFIAAFVYKANGVNLEQIKEVTGRYDGSGDRICWQHNVANGTLMAVYVTCTTYTGWVAVTAGNPGSARVLQMQRVDWNFQPPWI